MKIFIASDHVGYNLKNELLNKLDFSKDELIDLGTNSNESVDYPDYAFKLGECVVKENGIGIIICGTGIGVSIACNKVHGIRCAKITSDKEAYLAKSHNNANVMAIASYTPSKEAIAMVNTFVNTDFSDEERHNNRINKITSYEDTYEC